MNLIYREIDPNNYEDAYAFNLLYEFTYRDSSLTYIPDTEEIRIKKAKTLIENLLKDDKKLCCLAVFDGIEMIAGHFLDRYTIDYEPACHVHALWVHDDYRKMGIAAKLKILGEAWARAQGCVVMDTNVRVTNEKMIALNEKLGYEVARYNFRKRL